ncbi:MAG: excinuclease ABC subunit UvrC [Anaerolineales bacterium]|nr:excinuclease ABC subunit UvrC [Anaerolineales bacterium]
MTASEHLTGILDTLPQKPGCYLMKDEAGKVIYVGKAVNLRSRVRSYFQAGAGHDLKTEKLVRNIADIEWILVGSELEALILEMNLIKRYRPHYNIRLKDDKRYPYILVHWTDRFPKVTVTRTMERDGNRYFGPYTAVWAVHQTLDLLRRIFPYLTCNREITGADERACLWYDLKLCSAPCTGKIGQEEYRRMIDDLCRFLHGEVEAIAAEVERKMREASESLRYEQAARLRDRLQAIHAVVERQKIVSATKTDSDVVALARQEADACVQVFIIRGGRLIGREHFILEGTRGAEESEVLRQFLVQFYEEAAGIPAEVLLPVEVEETKIVEEWLRSRRGGQAVRISVPRSGVDRELVGMAAENAAETLKSLRAQWDADRSRQVEALAEVQKGLGLPRAPGRVECYDISNIQGTAVVASMVVFEQGVPNKAHYRRFQVRCVEGEPDDFASMREVLRRRFARWKGPEEEPVGRKKDPSFSALPDLLLVDGGKGQLAEAEKVLAEFGLTERVPAASLAKQEEEVFRPGCKAAIRLPRDSKGMFLLQRIRDEAHRFAITYHRSVRAKKGLASKLDSIPGIGPARRKLLLKTFGSLEAIRTAPVDELMKVRGITRRTADRLRGEL